MHPLELSAALQTASPTSPIIVGGVASCLALAGLSVADVVEHMSSSNAERMLLARLAAAHAYAHRCHPLSDAVPAADGTPDPDFAHARYTPAYRRLLIVQPQPLLQAPEAQNSILDGAWPLEPLQEICGQRRLYKRFVFYVPPAAAPAPVPVSESAAWRRLTAPALSWGSDDAAVVALISKVAAEAVPSRGERLAALKDVPDGGLVETVQPLISHARILHPHMEHIISDCAKMQVLDRLLARLKAEGHRVLVYSQMTRMIDLLEDFMNYRTYKYMRLDGTSKISERRDMVADFQNR
jgi:hypothetical protein